MNPKQIISGMLMMTAAFADKREFNGSPFRDLHTRKLMEDKKANDEVVKDKAGNIAIPNLVEADIAKKSDEQKHVALDQLRKPAVKFPIGNPPAEDLLNQVSTLQDAFKAEQERLRKVTGGIEQDIENLRKKIERFPLGRR